MLFFLKPSTCSSLDIREKIPVLQYELRSPDSMECSLATIQLCVPKHHPPLRLIPIDAATSVIFGLFSGASEKGFFDTFIHFNRSAK
jgi:hypothetical protein